MPVQLKTKRKQSGVWRQRKNTTRRVYRGLFFYMPNRTDKPYMKAQDKGLSKISFRLLHSFLEAKFPCIALTCQLIHQTDEVLLKSKI